MELHIQNLTKTYPNGVQALQAIDLHIQPGMFGLLGPNGAGKSSLMRTIATLQQPDAGSIRFAEIDVLHDPMSLRKILGYLPQDFGLYPKVSAWKLLDYFALLKGIASKRDRQQKLEEVLHLTNLYDKRHKAVSTYSGGMRQRFGIAQLLINDPQLIIVDEPTAGLDPAERNRFLNLLREIGANHLVIFSTHLVEDIEALCTDMAILNQGQILLQQSPQAAVSALTGKVWTKAIDSRELPNYEQQFNILTTSFSTSGRQTIRVRSDYRPDDSFQPAAQVSLEDVYFSYLKSN
ncbi:MAG: ABC transporter ATP-binding protein [Bacteroidota bacterium]